jgi:hypothetical protein
LYNRTRHRDKNKQAVTKSMTKRYARLRIRASSTKEPLWDAIKRKQRLGNPLAALLAMVSARRMLCSAFPPVPALSLFVIVAISDWLRAGRPRGQGSSTCSGKIFLLSTSSTSVLGPTQPPIRWVPGALPPEVKRPGRKADHSPPANVEVKNTWIYTYISPYTFLA